MSINLTAVFIRCGLMNARQRFIRGTRSVLQQNGTIVVRLPTSLQKKAPSEGKPAETVSDDEPVKRKRRPAMSLLGLLHLMWEQSGINVWHPIKRNAPLAG